MLYVYLKLQHDVNVYHILFTMSNSKTKMDWQIGKSAQLKLSTPAHQIGKFIDPKLMNPQELTTVYKRAPSHSSTDPPYYILAPNKVMHM